MGFSRQENWSGLPLPSPGIPADLFQILKDDAVKVLPSLCQQIWKTQQWPQNWKRSVLIPIPRRVMTKNIQTELIANRNALMHSNHTIALISHASKVMLKILQARLQQYDCMISHVISAMSHGITA